MADSQHIRSFLPTHEISILDVRLHIISVDQLLLTLLTAINQRTQIMVGGVNTHALNLTYTFPWFRDILNQCDVVFCDGMGVKIAAFLLGLPLPYRLTPPDWLPLLAHQCATRGYSLYLLGAGPGIAHLAAERLKRNAAGLIIAGSHHGDFDKSPQSADTRAICEQINKANPDVLLVAFGMPLQERWIVENRDALSAYVIIPVGGAFDYLSGKKPRAPRWLTDSGLEWLSRMVLEPRRLWRRYVVGLPLFLWRVVNWKRNR